MHYFYYLKLKNYLQYIFKPNFLLSWRTKQEILFKDTPEDGASLAPKHVG
jgi:hypothetical protein